MYRNKIEQIRNYAAECARIRDLTVDRATRELFVRLAKRLNDLADEVETATAERTAAN